MGSKLLAFVRRVEEALLAILLTAMIAVAAAQVLLRNFFEGGIYWGDSAVRVMGKKPAPLSRSNNDLDDREARPTHRGCCPRDVRERLVANSLPAFSRF